MHVIVNSTSTGNEPGSLRWAFKKSEEEPVRITFANGIKEISFSDIFYEAGDQEAKRARRITLKEECQGLELIGPVTLSGVSFLFERVGEPIRFENIRVRPGSKNYGKGINVDCLFAEKCLDLELKKCTFMWANDELLSFNKCDSILIDRCIVGDPLHIPTYNGEFVHKEGFKGSHGYGLRASSNKLIKIYRSVFASCSHRNPQLNNDGCKENEKYRMLVRNCLIYNYGDGPTYNNKPDEEEQGKTKFTFQLQNNLFVPGARTSPKSWEVDLELPQEGMRFVLRDVDSNRILHRPSFTLREDDKLTEIPNGEGPTFDMNKMLPYFGAQPQDKVDHNLMNDIGHAMKTEVDYDNLDEDNYYKRWEESGWRSSAP